MCVIKNDIMRCYVYVSSLFYFFTICASLYDYTCDDDKVYKSYVRAHENNRKGDIIPLYPSLNGAVGDSPNFYPITANNTYICINGPAYLYFSKTTVLGEVFESPRMEVYDHICDTYNVFPGRGATKKNITEQLHAILLMGDETNYYRHPALQLFTAPYYDGNDGVKKYINATSLIVFGKEDCFIEKGGVPFRIKTNPTPKSTTTGEDIEEKKGRYCKLGYSKLLKTTTEAKILHAREILQNVDFTIRNSGCSLGGYQKSAQTFESLRASLEKKTTEYKKQLAALGTDAEIEEKINSAVTAKNALKPTEKVKLAKKEKEIARLTNLRALVAIIKSIVDDDPAIKPEVFTGTKVGIDEVVRSSVHFNKERQLKTKYKKLRDEEVLKLKREPYNFKAIEAKILEYNAKIIAPSVDIPPLPNEDELKSKWNEIAVNLTSARKIFSKLDLYFEESKKKVIANDTDLQTLGTNITEKFVDSTDIEFTALFTGENIPPYCTEMRESTQICTKAKPDKDEVCNIFKNSLGYLAPVWGGGATDASVEPEKNNKWKDGLLDLIEEIFNIACFRVPKKFSRNVHRIFKYYLTVTKYFNKKTPPPSRAPPSSTDPVPPSTAESTNQKERPFWSHIKTALLECKKNMPLLFITPNIDKTNLSGWTIKRKNEESPIEIVHHQEQADLEYTFNYVIDWQYKIFSTVLGLCMPTYEAKVPLITSRFYAMYTEDFIIPLRETWINSKDNAVFDWILGEFKYHETDHWVRNCMEASFLETKKLEYRPPRCVLVNGNKEHNYYISGTFPYGHKGRYATAQS